MTREVAFCGLDVGITTTDAVAGWDAQAVVRSVTMKVGPPLYAPAGPPANTAKMAVTAIHARRI